MLNAVCVMLSQHEISVFFLIVKSFFFFYRKIVLLGDIKSKPINPAGVTYGGLRGAYQA